MSDVLCQKYAPTKIGDMMFSEENKKTFNDNFDLQKSSNLLFIGSPGVGKTTLAKILAKKYDYLYLNASDESGVDVIRTKVSNFVKTASMFGTLKVVVLDEADGLSSVNTGNGSSAQQALRGIIEENLDSCRFILTANYEHRVSEALQSRCQTFKFSLSKRDCAKRLMHIVKEESIKIDKSSLFKLIKAYFPDLRKCINELQKGLDENKTFKFSEVDVKNLASQIKSCVTKIKGKPDKSPLFDLREALIKGEDDFRGDYHLIMRGLFDLYCEDKNTSAILTCCHHMEKHNIVLDKEVNFTSLLLNLAN